jgi:hypothetical protein
VEFQVQRFRKLNIGDTTPGKTVAFACLFYDLLSPTDAFSSNLPLGGISISYVSNVVHFSGKFKFEASCFVHRILSCY